MKIWTAGLLAIYFILLFAGCDSSDNDRINASDPAPEGEEETDADYLGLTHQQAETRAFRRNQAFRYSIIDGESQPLTLDFNPDRLNFTSERGVIIGITRG